MPRKCEFVIKKRRLHYTRERHEWWQPVRSVSFLSMVLGGFRYTYCDDILDCVSHRLCWSPIFSYCNIVRLTFVVLVKYIYNNYWTDSRYILVKMCTSLNVTFLSVTYPNNMKPRGQKLHHAHTGLEVVFRFKPFSDLIPPFRELAAEKVGNCDVSFL